MSLWSKIRGTIETIFQIGIGGPQIKNNAGVIEMRNSTDGAFAITRGLSPVGNNDYATKLYVDSEAEPNAILEIRYVTGTGATQDSTALIPANAYVVSAEFKVTTPYSGGTTVSVGQNGNTTLLLLTADNDPLTNGTYQVMQDTTWGGSPLAVRTTVGGAPGVGAGVTIVRYGIPAT